MARRGLTVASLVSATLGAAAWPGVARAQLTLPILQPVIPFTYSRGRNVSVTERERPEVTPTGIPVAGFTLYPRVDLGAGATDNAFQTNLDRRHSAFFSIVPQVKAYSDWSRHSLRLDAGGDLRRYTAEPIRDQSGWHAGANGRYDLGGYSSISASASTAKQYETRFSGSTPADVSSAIPYQLSNGQLSGQATFGKVRALLITDFSDVSFSAVRNLSDARVDQAFRNRRVATVTGQIEYALTSDVSLFGQFGYANTNYYDKSAVGADDRDSDELRGVAGISLDLTSLVRGSLGVGYIDRHYASPLFSRVAGLAMEARFEYFPSALTTFTLAARRAIQDASIAGTAGYFNTGAGLRIDHELLRNLILTAGVDYERDTYRGVDARARIFAANAGAHFLMTRHFGLAATLSYGQRHSDGVRIGSVFSETSGLLSVYFQR